MEVIQSYFAYKYWSFLIPSITWSGKAATIICMTSTKGTISLAHTFSFSPSHIHSLSLSRTHILFLVHTFFVSLTHAHTRTHTYTYTHTYTHTHIHTPFRTRTHVHTYTQTHVWNEYTFLGPSFLVPCGDEKCFDPSIVGSSRWPWHHHETAVFALEYWRYEFNIDMFFIAIFGVINSMIVISESLLFFVHISLVFTFGSFLLFYCP